MRCSRASSASGSAAATARIGANEVPEARQLLLELSEARWLPCPKPRRGWNVRACPAPPPAPASSTGCSRWRPNVRARSIAASSNSSWTTRSCFAAPAARRRAGPAARQDRSRGPAGWRRVPRHRLQVEDRAGPEAHHSAAGLHLRRRAAAAQGRRLRSPAVRGLLPVDGGTIADQGAEAGQGAVARRCARWRRKTGWCRRSTTSARGISRRGRSPRSLCAMCPFDSVCRKQFVEAVVEATPDE